ncbi:heme/hemin ABC transporter substrate-binding protein [Primorskyibacter sp. S187A]|uniref:heme/hemin ABC transporter substrate-binding protein n=1 Tax=Primorskyibacter sp. S187A TaxID=3415130 RepID=UPI003C7C77AB
MAVFIGLFGALTAWMVSAEQPQAQAKSPEANVLALGGDITEIVFALGQGHRLVARDTTSTYPPEARNLTDVGYVRALSPEGVLSVEPELILAAEGAGPVEAIEVLREASIDFVTVPQGFDAQAIAEKIRVIGTALDVPERAEDLVFQMMAGLDAARAQADAREDAGKRVLFVLSTQGGRIMASGRDTGAAHIIEMAGGVNAISEFEGYKQISEEAVITAAPDVILMMDRGGNHGATPEELFALPAMAATPAAETEALVRMNGLLLLGFGPRTPDAIRELSAALAES